MNSTSVLKKPKHFLITAGEPAGIGPDIVIRLAQQDTQQAWIVIADPALLRQRAEQINLPLKIIELDKEQLAKPLDKSLYSGQGQLLCLPVKLYAPVNTGQLNKANAQYVLDSLTLASELCMANYASALVTGPIHKGIINEMGIPFTGHTEFLADLSQTKQVIMMLATPGLRVALMTTHLPLKDVSEAITSDLCYRVMRLLHLEMQDKFGLKNPNILVCGLNPHAGEDGHMGREEIDTIIPMLEKCQQEGLELSGPYPADTVFTDKYLSNADAVLAMYHDQGLPVLKYKGFGNAVNITLGLPFIRTSVDHGTALDLAGTDKVNLGSMQYAIEVALDAISQHNS